VATPRPDRKTLEESARPLSLPVFQDDDVPVGLLPGQDLRIARNAEHPKPPAGIKTHRNGPLDDRIGGEELNLEAVGNLKELALDFGIVALGIEGGLLLEGAGLGDPDQRAQEPEEDKSRGRAARPGASDAPKGSCDGAHRQDHGFFRVKA
jgi:hypothetical protein